jgi:hypothetical protein
MFHWCSSNVEFGTKKYFVNCSPGDLTRSLKETHPYMQRGHISNWYLLFLSPLPLIIVQCVEKFDSRHFSVLVLLKTTCSGTTIFRWLIGMCMLWLQKCDSKAASLVFKFELCLLFLKDVASNASHNPGQWSLKLWLAFSLCQWQFTVLQPPVLHFVLSVQS